MYLSCTQCAHWFIIHITQHNSDVILILYFSICRLECHDFRLKYVNFRIWKDIIAFKELPQGETQSESFFSLVFSLFFLALFFPHYFKIFWCSVLQHLIGFFFQPSILNMFLFRFSFGIFKINTGNDISKMQFFHFLDLLADIDISHVQRSKISAKIHRL